MRNAWIYRICAEDVESRTTVGKRRKNVARFGILYKYININILRRLSSGHFLASEGAYYTYIYECTYNIYTHIMRFAPIWRISGRILEQQLAWIRTDWLARFLRSDNFNHRYTTLINEINEALKLSGLVVQKHPSLRRHRKIFLTDRWNTIFWVWFHFFTNLLCK